MNLQALQQLITRGESETLEFKQSTGQRSAATKTVCAMLNGLGGFVLFGVTNAGELRGQTVSAGSRNDVAHELGRIEPPAFPEMETVALDNGQAVLILRVSGSGNGVYTYDGRPYLRVGATTQVMPQAHYEQRLMERLYGTHRWENRPAEGLTLADLDHTEIARTVEEAIRRGRLEEPGTREPAALLTGLGLIHNGQLLRAAVVLFGKEDRLLHDYPHCVLRLARFRGRDKTEFVDNRQEFGNAFTLFIRAQRFMRDHLPIAGRIVPGIFERIDEPLYPTAALREALVNALCHRDYAIWGGAVSVGIYDDRLEITSTGILHFGLTPEDLTRPHESRLWNPLIAGAFYRRGAIEAWGRGTLRMAEWTTEAGLPAPEFECRAGEVVVRFRPTRYTPPTRVGHDLSPLQRELLAILAETGPARLSQIRTHLRAETPERTVRANLQMLRDFGLIVLHGSRRAAYWMLKVRDS